MKLPRALTPNHSDGLGERRPRVLSDRMIAGLRAWHAVGAVIAAVFLWLVISPSTKALPGAIRGVMTALNVGFVAGHVMAARGIKSRTSPGRTASVITNYFVFLMSAVMLMHRIGVFHGFGAFSTGFFHGFVAVPLGAIAAMWIVAARKLAPRSPSVGRVMARVGWAGVAAVSLYFLNKVDAVGGIGHALKRIATQPITLGSLLLCIASAWAMRLMWHPAVAAQFGANGRINESLSGLAFLSPNIIGLTVFFAGPLIFSLFISFFNWDTIGASHQFRGFGNYIEMLSLDSIRATNIVSGAHFARGYQQLMHLDIFGGHWVIAARDPVFWISLRNIVIFLVLSVPLAVIPALCLSTLLMSKMPGMKVFRAIFFVPSVAGVVAVALTWRSLFATTIGWLNYLIKRTGDTFGFGATQVQWLTSKNLALLSLVIVFAWSTFGFNTVLYLAGHQGIPGEMYEAAELDGANAWQRFRHITVPSLRPTTFYVLATTAILAMQLFDLVYVMTGADGSPENSTQTPVLHLYDEGFNASRQGYASAVAWVLFLLIFGLTMVQFRRQREESMGGMA